MSKQSTWVLTRVRLGWLLLAAGVLAAIVGVFMQLQYSNQPYNYRIITGFGVLLVGVGIGYLVRYRRALKDERSAKRLTAEERDERTVLIRHRAGSRAFWVSIALTYLGLMWASFADRGDLPPLGGDILWYFLAAATVIPFAIYIIGILLDERYS